MGPPRSCLAPCASKIAAIVTGACENRCFGCQALATRPDLTPPRQPGRPRERSLSDLVGGRRTSRCRRRPHDRRGSVHWRSGGDRSFGPSRSDKQTRARNCFGRTTRPTPAAIEGSLRPTSPAAGCCDARFAAEMVEKPPRHVVNLLVVRRQSGHAFAPVYFRDQVRSRRRHARVARRVSRHRPVVRDLRCRKPGRHVRPSPARIE